jgi:hypothetical protein
MINATSNEVVIHVPMDKVKVRVAGMEQDAYRPSRGFAYVESSDGVLTPITTPFYDWFINAVYNGNTPDQSVSFIFDGGSPRGPDLDAGGEMDLGV